MIIKIILGILTTSFSEFFHQIKFIATQGASLIAYHCEVAKKL